MGYSTTDPSLVFGIIRKAEKLTGICYFNGLQLTVGVNMQLTIMEQLSLMGCNLNRLVVSAPCSTITDPPRIRQFRQPICRQGKVKYGRRSTFDLIKTF